MYRYFRRTAAHAAVFAAMLAASVFSLAAPALAADPVDSHVVIISLDGFAAFLLNDPKAPIPTIRRLAKEGAVCESGMRVSNPSVTWPNHTSMVTGYHPEKHGVLANGVLVRGAIGVPVLIDPKRDKSDLVRVATLYDTAHAAGMTTAEVNWPCTRGSTALDDSFPDVPEAVDHMTPRLREELIAAGLLADSTDKSFKSGSIVGRDLIWTETACHLIRARQPNLLLVHLLNIDATHHAEGAQSSAGYTANAYADTCVEKIIDALDSAGLRERTTVFIVSDHGFTLTPKALRPNVILRQEKLLTADESGKVIEARIHVVPEGGIGLVYCTDPGRAEADRTIAEKLLTGQEGVAGILRPEEFIAHGLPHPREYAQSPDLVLVAQDGYAVSASAAGDTFVTGQVEGKVSLGSHGFLSTNPKMNALCILAGRGVRSGAPINDPENIDIAPTAAALLGLEDFQVDGRVLSEGLLESK
ncbi:MAG: alkaline phosphatase family protein [Pirellulales bacterium]